MEAQETVTVTLGAGWFFEGYNVGLKGSFGRFQISGNYGFKYLLGDKVDAYGLHGFYYFSKQNIFSDRRVWYARTGFTHMVWSEINRKRWGWFDTRIGRDFNIFKKFGIQADVGFLYFVYNRYYEYASESWIDEEIRLKEKSPLWPCGSLTLFYRI